MVLQYAGHDQAAFRRTVENIIRELSVRNSQSEAKALRQALQTLSVSVHRAKPVQTTAVLELPRQNSGLLSFGQADPGDALFFSCRTRNALDRIILEHRNADRLGEAGLRPKTRLLFWGPPGCGKTSAAQFLAKELSLQCGIVRLGSLITSFVGETGSNLQKVLSLAEQSPMVLLIDEADAVAKARNDANDVGELRRVVNSLLQGLDGIASKKSIVILASNHSHLFDPAIWRRFDDVVEFGLPTLESRITQLKHLTSGLPIKGGLSAAAKAMEGWSYADISRAVSEVAKTKVLNDLDSVTPKEIVEEGRQWRKNMHAAGKSFSRDEQ